MSMVNETSVCLTAASEEMLFNKLMFRSYCGFPLNKIQVKGAAKKVLMEAYKSHSEKRDLQQQLKVTDEWFLYFTEKYPDIMENMFKGKHGKSCFEKKASSVSEVEKWHENVMQHISRCLPDSEQEERLKADPRRVFFGTVDNFLFRDRIGKYVRRGMWGVDDFTEMPKKRSDENMACMTVFNSAGDVAPVLLNIKSSRVSPIFKDNFPKEWSIECNSSGWMDTNSMISYINKFKYWIERKEIETPVVLFLLTNNLYMHIDVTDFCEKKEIILFSLPQHLFSTIMSDNLAENVINRIKDGWCLEESVTRLNFASIYSNILSNIPLSAFEQTFLACGIWKKDSIDLSQCIEEVKELGPTELALDSLEKILPQRTLLQFQNCYPYQLWLNHVQNASLFQVWLKLKRKARGLTKIDSEDMYDEEFSDEIPECVEIEPISPPTSNSPTPVEPEMIIPDSIMEQETTTITIPQTHTINITESDVAVASIQRQPSEDSHDDHVHDTIAIALANMGEMDCASSKVEKRTYDDDASPVPIKIPKEQLVITRGKVDGRGVITSLLQNQSLLGRLNVPSMPVNPSMPRNTCKIISPELAEASVDRRVAAGISFRAKVPPSVLAALRNNVSPITKRTKKEHT